MKLCSVFLLVTLLNTTASVFSQNVTISLNLQNASLKTVLEEIEKSSPYKFIYRNDLVNVNKVVNIKAKDESLAEVLNSLFNSSGVSYKVFEGNIVVLTNQAMQQRKITGKVTDASSGEPLPGVNVVIKGTNIGAITDPDGNYSIEISKDTTLVFSFIGYLQESIAVEGKSVINISLSPDVKKLDEVIVVAYGTTTKKNFTGSTTNIRMKDSPLAIIPHTDAMDVLRGTVPGLSVSQEQGAGQTPTLLIRGQKSVNGGTSPLIVLDGVIFMGEMRDIDPSSIESVNVLKDATSVAAYGSRAANGVILINTKRGQKGKPVINFQTSFGTLKVINKAKVLSPENWIKKVNLLQGLAEGADPNTWMSEFEKENYAKNQTTDWQDFVERTGHSQNYSLSMSGGGDRMNYFVSGAYTKNEGVLIGDDYDRISLSTRLNMDITDWLQVGDDINFSFNDYSGPTTYNIYQSIRLTPYGRPYRDDNSKLLEKFPACEGAYRLNPLWGITDGSIDDHDVYYTTVLGGHSLIKCPWIKGLSYRINFSYTIKSVEKDYFTHEGYFVKEYSGTPDARYDASTVAGFLASANGYSGRTKDLGWVWDNIINYSNSFGKHNIDLTAVYTRDSYKYIYKYITGSDFAALGNTNLGYNGLSYATTQVIKTFNNTLHNNIGYLIRGNYNFDNKYHLTASIRRDGSSVFGEDNKWGIFPSVGAAWTVSDESFLKNIKAIDYLKLKISWGKNGNQSLNPYETLSTITLGKSGGYSYPFGNTSTASFGQRVNQIGNTGIGWEETSALNYGFEFSTLKNRVNINMDGYFSKTENQIFDLTIPVMANGITTMEATMGQVNNWGIEVTLNTQNIKISNFEWNSSVVYYLNRNKLVELDGSGNDNKDDNLYLGKPLESIYGYKNIGIVQEDETEYIAKYTANAGDVKYLDKDNNGSITADDKCILGNKKDNFRMSFANTFRYKNFELYALFNGIFGGKDYYKAVNIYAYRTASDVVWDNNFDHGWWTSENRSNKYPRINYTNSNYTPVQSRGFVRLQNLSLSYNFKQPWVKKMNINNLRAYVSATNLFTITNWEGGDPETAQTLGSGYSYGYPLSSTYSVGVDLSF